MTTIDHAPAPQPQPPARRQLGEHREPRARILGALGVVGRAAKHGGRPAPRAVFARGVERLQRKTEVRRMPANFIESDEPVVAIEGGVLHSLRHDRRGELLEAHREAQHLLAPQPFRRRRVQREHAMHEIESVRVGNAAAALRRPHGPVDPLAVRLGDAACAHVAPIHREARRDLGERLAQAARGEVAREAVAGGDAREPVREHQELGRERGVHDEVAAGDRDVLEARALAGEALIDAVEMRLGVLVDEDAGEHVDEAIAGGAVDRPVLGQVLVVREDLLHHDPWADEGLVQPLQILARIGQPIGMVDAQAIDAAALGEPADQAVRRLEHRAVLDADAGEVGDLEEAPVVDLVRRHAPVGEPVVLALEQAMQRHGVFHRLQIPGAAGIEREAVVEIAHAPAPAFVLELELARLQHFAVVLPQNR